MNRNGLYQRDICIACFTENMSCLLCLGRVGPYSSTLRRVKHDQTSCTYNRAVLILSHLQLPSKNLCYKRREKSLKVCRLFPVVSLGAPETFVLNR